MHHPPSRNRKKDAKPELEVVTSNRLLHSPNLFSRLMCNRTTSHIRQDTGSGGHLTKTDKFL